MVWSCFACVQETYTSEGLGAVGPPASDTTKNPDGVCSLWAKGICKKRRGCEFKRPKNRGIGVKNQAKVLSRMLSRTQKEEDEEEG